MAIEQRIIERQSPPVVRGFSETSEIMDGTEGMLPVIAFCDFCPTGYVRGNFKNPDIEFLQALHRPCGRLVLIKRPEDSLIPK